MGEHPIESLMNTAMNSIKDMIDVNTIIGEPIQASNNTVIIPISKVGFGFAAGGSEFRGETLDEYTKRDKEEQVQYRLPFGGGSGAGVSISPVAFLVVQPNNVKLLPVDHTSSLDRLLDYVPDILEKLNTTLNKQLQNKRDDKIQDDRRKEKERQEQREERMQAMQSIQVPISAQTSNKTSTQMANQQVKPRKSMKYHKPEDLYEFEYDETDDDENGME